ncbi:CinA family protein [Altericroceibacterium xinjiangense]|uniref:CinA family protein n=1 Tax=Altericroceibacterium xinjiangense TaxID=762261 RepID=UPI000F7E105B|nr:CinA family protein [Altericroceibacterium xinjiangense]
MADTLDPALPDDIIERAQAVLKLADKKQLYLATAESCTGGLLAAVLTDHPGSSHMFDRGFVSYSKQAKCDLLDIEREKVDSCGAVSREVAVDMAAGAIKQSNADVALSITGFAGPAGDGNEEGLVHFACARKGGDIAHREEHFGPVGRDGVRRGALKVALEMMEEALQA